MPDQRNNRSGGPGGQGRGQGRGPRRDDRPREQEQEGPSFDERVVDIGRTAKVVKGGRHFGFRAVVVVGDNKGTVGVGVGKAREVPDAVRKGTEKARKAMRTYSLSDNTIPHPVTAKFGASQVMLKPATPGTGVIAGGGVRAVLECAGVHDVLTKSLGSSNKLNVVRATILALSQMQSAEREAYKRGKEAADLLPPWRKTNGNAN
ncbi:MAG: 30S ribosomal protein S5 [Chloroflexota bacterium]|nr:MAG: 30S ribosomal protein S5 [Chloroflexota bacterium]